MESINEYIYPAEEGGQHRHIDTMQEYIRLYNLELGFDGTYDSQLEKATERVNNRYLLIKEDATFNTGPIYKDRMPKVDQLENVEPVNDTTIRADLRLIILNVTKSGPIILKSMKRLHELYILMKQIPKIISLLLKSVM